MLIVILFLLLPLLSCSNFSITYELMANLCEIFTQGYLSKGPHPRVMCHQQPDVFLKAFLFLLLPLMSCPNFSLKDVLLTNLLGSNFLTGILDSGFTLKGSMSLVTRCNANSYSVFVIVNHVMSCPYFSLIDVLLTNLLGSNVLTGVPYVRGNNKG